MERPAHDRNAVGMAVTWSITSVGLDAHQKAIDVAGLLARATKPQDWVVLAALLSRLERSSGAGAAVHTLRRYNEVAAPSARVVWIGSREPVLQLFKTVAKL
jgi:hypothetical protein